MKKTLYLGLDLPGELNREEVTHCPIIHIIPRPKEHPDIIQAFAKFEEYTHIVFTSKNAVRIFFDYAMQYGITTIDLNQKIFLAVGKKTAQELNDHNINEVLTAANETAEGIAELIISRINLHRSFIFWPHSVLSRPMLVDWMQFRKCKHYACIFYDTVLRIPETLPDIASFHEIIFTSPSTVDAYCSIFGKLPADKILTCIGPVTKNYLLQISSSFKL